MEILISGERIDHRCNYLFQTHYIVQHRSTSFQYISIYMKRSCKSLNNLFRYAKGTRWSSMHIKDTDQAVRLHSLIRVFVWCF